MADLSDGTRWFETDGANNFASPNGWPEGMMPSGVNDSARADKGALKRFWDKINPVQVITPAGGVWSFTTSNAAYPASYIVGEVYTFYANGDSVGGDQFQVNALGAKPIMKHLSGAFVAISALDIAGGYAPQLIYNAGLAGGTGGFLLLNPHVPVSGDGAGGASLGNTTITGTLGVSGAVTAGSVQTAGVVTASQYNINGIPFANGDGTTTHIYDGSGGSGLHLQAAINYYDADTHVFRNNAGSGNAAVIDAGNLAVTGAITAGGNITAPNFIGHVTGTVSVPANGPISTGGTVTGGTVTSTGNITAPSGTVSAVNLSASNDVTAAGSITGGIIHSAGLLQVDGQTNLLQTLNVGPGGGYARFDAVGSYNVSGSWLTFSDRRVKEDILPYSRGLDAILALDPVTYVYRPGTPFADDERTVRLGLVAQDVLPVLPELVGRATLAGEEMATLVPGNLVYALINAAKELAARNTALAARVAALEADVARG